MTIYVVSAYTVSQSKEDKHVLFLNTKDHTFNQIEFVEIEMNIEVAP